MSEAARIEAMAALWLARAEDADWAPEDQQTLDAWLDESLAHKAAFWRLRHGWREADRIAALGDAPLAHANPAPSVRSTLTTRPLLGWAIAASLAMVIGLGTVVRFGSPRAPVTASPDRQVRTAVGGRRAIALADGSKVELNTATTVRTAPGPASREVWLDRGEAFFDIAHDAEHPFVVHAGLRDVTVLGTRFTVRRDGDDLTVAVVSGRVRVDDVAGKGAARSAVIGKGDVAYARPTGTLVAMAAPAQVGAMTGWRSGLLVFENRRLSDAVAEFNRYTTRPMEIRDPKLSALRIGGTFRIENSKNFLELLESAYGLHVEEQADRIVIRS